MGLVASRVDWVLEFMSQGCKQRRTSLITLDTKKPVLKTMEDLGMREGMREQLRTLLNGHKSIFMFSAPAGHGLPTTWRVAIDTADKFIRDWVSLEDKREPDPELINVTQHYIKSDEAKHLANDCTRCFSST